MFEPMIYKASENVKEFEPHTDKYIVPIKDTGKNRAKITAVSQTTHGVTITVNEDGSIKANGTATENIYFSLGKLNLEHGSFKLSGCSGGSTSTYLLYFQKEDGHGYIPAALEKGVSVILVNRDFAASSLDQIREWHHLYSTVNSKVIDKLMKLGTEVVYSSLQNVHTSGHGSKEELKNQLNLMLIKKHQILLNRTYHKVQLANTTMKPNRILNEMMNTVTLTIGNTMI